ncbi:MAG TPA: hypothetical protein GXZ43_07790 [Clostridiaceae bacterium]|mgnify:CR=1 FL=1|nr:hypothetical protein [Clostridiaceae bacterium]
MTNNNQFSFKPADFVPFKDQSVLERVRTLQGEDYLNHSNPDFKINVIPNDMLNTIFVTDMLNTIIRAKEEGRNAVMIIPNPSPSYKHLAWMINRLRIDCKHVITFNMDEWADENGNIADESYPNSFIRSTKKFLLSNIDPELRMPEENLIYPTNENIDHYSDLILEAGGADVCYSGPGWSGHLAFIDPDVPEFAGDLDEFMKMGTRVTSLHPLTIAQNSLHGCFGASGDIANVPPKAATIGPRDVAASKRRIEMHGISTAGTFVAWQRLISRLVLHGPVTPSVPSSILQLLGADVYVTETIAAPVVPDYEFQY